MISRLARSLALAMFLLFLGFLLFEGFEQRLGATPHSRVREFSSTDSVSLTVSAAISLKDALDEIKIAFAKQRPSTVVTFNFGASGMLQHQIENGAPVDLFLSAAPKQMDALEAKGLLLPESRRDLVRNQLVLIVPKDSYAITGFADLKRASVTRVALGEPSSVPAGQYAQEALRYFKILDAVKSKFILAKDVRQVLTYVESGNADVGIAYRSDALTDRNVRIVAEAPMDSHSPIRYPVAIIRASRHPHAAREFLAYLCSESAGQVFVKRGFLLIAL